MLSVLHRESPPCCPTQVMVLRLLTSHPARGRAEFGKQGVTSECLQGYLDSLMTFAYVINLLPSAAWILPFRTAAALRLAHTQQKRCLTLHRAAGAHQSRRSCQMADAPDQGRLAMPELSFSMLDPNWPLQKGADGGEGQAPLQ